MHSVLCRVIGFCKILLVIGGFCSIVFSGNLLYAQPTKVTGTITDTSGRPLAYANVYLKGTTTGTTTNEEGHYQLEIPKQGQQTLVFQYTGYERKERTVNPGNGVMRISVILKPQSYNLQTVEVTDRDPAYRIMQNAIDRKSQYQQEVRSYECKSYSKGKMRLEEAPAQILGEPIDSSQKGLIYLSESVSRLYYQYPDELKEAMISSKVSGNSQGISLNFAANNPISFYQNRLRPEGMTHRPLVSPLADNAFNFYEFRWKGTFENNGRKIHRIKLQPKRSRAPAFSGTINILDNSWRIYSLALFVYQANGLRSLDTLQIQQSYLPVNDSVWRLYNQNFEFSAGMMGIKLNGQFLNHFSEYDLNPDFAPDFFDNELLKITEESTERDSAYWEKVRPVKLLPEEERDYKEKDSLEKVQNTEEYLDSVDRENNKPSLRAIFLTGYSYRKRTQNFELGFNSLLGALQFNAVEGLVANLEADLEISPEDGEAWHFRPFGRYGFSNKHVNGGMTVEHGNWEIGGGRDVAQFDRDDPVLPGWNTMYALFDKRNHLKIYEKTYVQGAYEREIINGLQGSLGLEWNQRAPLANTTEYTFKDGAERSYLPNVPENPAINPDGFFAPHQALIGDLRVRIRFDQDYYMIKGEKLNLESDYPELHLRYRKGIDGMLNSEVDFDYVEARITGDHSFDLLGDFEYRLSAGRFLRKPAVPFVDFRHINGNQMLVGDGFLKNFQMLDYYVESTVNPFAKAQVEHRFNGMLWNQVPWLKKLPWQVVANGNFLMKQGRTGYWEWGAGLENLLSAGGMEIGRVQYYQGFYGDQMVNQGIRIGLPF